ncbi:hypothetical protein pdam_00019735 [Pocillopora damicornis]|uniref:Uncharacterized protein n=1 Tax=Pocillopora damicornis TaxID=46731 RepID=A0A3M6TVP7_POCDA|nr:hypothetical protein pdam_00019735 [Pocillopora damicornis]
MPSTFQIRFVVLIVALGRVVDNSFSYRASPGSKIRCKWNCFAHVADLTVLKREMANSTTINNKLIKLIVRYEKQIDDKCTNQKSVNSSESSSEHCSVCLVNKRLFNSMTPNKSAINPFLHKEHSEIRAICTLKPARTTVSSPVDYSNRSFAICELIKFEADFESIDHHAVKTDPLGLCMNFTIPDRTNSTEGLQGAVKLRGWPKTVLDFFAFVFIGVFIYYSPAFLCLFCPTEILQDGVTHIILEGASPAFYISFFSKRHYLHCSCNYVMQGPLGQTDYSSFTKTYHELALTLYDCHMDSKRTQSQDVPSSSDQLPKLPNNTHDPDNVIAIPKELFEMACEKLLPLREGVCLLILKISVLVFSVLIVFSWATMFSFDTTPLMKTLLTFLTLAFPKIVAIYIDGGWQKKLRERVRKEKVPKIVEKFISRTSMTTRGQRDRNANIDEVNLFKIL